VIDYRLPDGTALDALPKLKAIDPSVPIIVLTGHGSVELAVEAMKQGADYFLTKPLDLDRLAAVIEQAIVARQNRTRRATDARSELAPLPDPFLGISPAIEQLRTQATRLAATDSTVVLQGETGSGKGVLAHWLHRHGPRRERAFVELNCATLSAEFLATELFGHNKGAFTSAVSSKAGLLETAHGGSLFLDEIGDMNVQVQSMLLKVLEEKRFRRMGETVSRQVDVRLITATHHDLRRLVRENRFRSDLYFRIHTVVLQVPALRERKEDIPILAESRLAQIAATKSAPRLHVSTEAMRALAEHPWPGNIRELRNVLERAALFASGRMVGVDHLFFDEVHPIIPAAAPIFEPRLTLAEVERRHIQRVLEEEGGHVVRAAKRLGLPRSSLYAKLRALRMRPREMDDISEGRMTG
jgi:DNA-binding NtrC family response regulator